MFLDNLEKNPPQRTFTEVAEGDPEYSVKKFKNACDTSYTLGQRVMVWNRRDKKYSDMGTVVDMEEGDDGFHRSFIIDLDQGTEVHLLGNHLLPAPEEENVGQGIEIGAV